MTATLFLFKAALASCLLATLSLARADTQMSITAYRPLQYEAGPGFPLGPWGRTNLAGVSVNSCDKLLEGLHASVLPPNRRFLCVAKPTALTIQEIEKLLDTTHMILLVLPPPGAPIDAAATQHIQKIEKILLDRHSLAAVAFANETPDLAVLIERLRQDEDIGQALSRARSMRPFLAAYSHFKQEWQPARNVKGVTLTSWLRGATKPDGSAAPVLILAAHHDAFASVPYYATGVSSSASGAIALMWLARELGKVYKQNEIDFSVAFVLADASALNYEGIAQWIGRADPRLLNATKYVLCLDNVASTSLNLHTPKVYKNPEAARLLRAIEDALKAEGVSLSTRTRKIALGEKLLPFWPHEHFTRAKLIAGSLSAESELKHLWNRSSLADNRLDEEALAKTTRGLAEGIARFLLNVEKTENRLTHRWNADHLDLFIGSWTKFSAKNPRFFAYRSIPAYVGSPFASNRFIKSVVDEMENAGLSVEQYEFDVDMGGFSFSYEAPLTIQVAEARPAFFDWLLLLGATAYSLALYLFIRETTKSKMLSGNDLSE